MIGNDINMGIMKNGMYEYGGKFQNLTALTEGDANYRFCFLCKWM
jgi:hypothetical protein